MSSSSTENGGDYRPVLRVVRGDPTVQEVAALVTVIAARSAAVQRGTKAGPPAYSPSHTSAWTDRSLLVRRPLPHGVNAWRSSGLLG